MSIYRDPKKNIYLNLDPRNILLVSKTSISNSACKGHYYELKIILKSGILITANWSESIYKFLMDDLDQLNP